MTERIGVCSKCGDTKIVRDHHYKGYDTEETAPYCLSCDYKAHIKAKKEGRCVVTGIESARKTKNSNHKRSYKSFEFNTTFENGIYLRESIQVNIFTMNPSITSRFIVNNKTRDGLNDLKYIDEGVELSKRMM